MILMVCQTVHDNFSAIQAVVNLGLVAHINLPANMTVMVSGVGFGITKQNRYHDLASLFQAIALSDRLRMSLLPEGSADDTFECDMAGVPVDRTNLVLRAVDTFRAATVRQKKMHTHALLGGRRGIGVGSVRGAG